MKEKKEISDWSGLRLRKSTIKKIKVLSVKNDRTMQMTVDALVNASHNLLSGNKN